MLIPIGFAVVLLSVFGGFVLSGGSLGPLFQPTELLMIGGAGVGAFIASNHGKALKATFRIFPRLRRSKRYDKAMYMELMALLYRLLAKVRRDGMLGIERDIDNPAESALFSEYPKVVADPMIMNFLTDYLRLMVAGLFDRFPKLQIILGHCGEALPFWLYRINYMHSHISVTGRYPNVGPLKRKAEGYLRENFIYTNSGVGWAPPVMFVRDVIGPDRMMYAMDYPWQFVPEEVAWMDDLPLDDAGKKQFYEDNARRVFKIAE